MNWDLWLERPHLEGVLHAMTKVDEHPAVVKATIVRFICFRKTTQATAFRLIKCLIKAYFGSEKNIPVDSRFTWRHSPRHEKGN